MKKIKFKSFKLKKVNIQDLDDRTLLLNLYFTQFLSLFIGLFILFFQKQNPLHLFDLPQGYNFIVWGAGLAVAVIVVDVLISRWIPEEATDDGGINEIIFKNRPLWHIAVISFVVAVCEELLFRGAIQHAFGPYWTSILFAAIHIRYLKHWIPTGLVFSISYGIGWVYVHTGTIWTPIAAHFLIDLVMGCIIRYRRET